MSKVVRFIEHHGFRLTMGTGGNGVMLIRSASNEDAWRMASGRRRKDHMTYLNLKLPTIYAT